MATSSRNLNLKQVFTGHNRARPHCQNPCLQTGEIVHAVARRSRKTLEQAVIDHRLSAEPVFFVGLENEIDRPIETTVLCQIRRRTKQHRAMPIMPTGVHFLLVL